MKPIYKPKGAAAEYGDYAVNIYTGCPHRCYYCFAPQGSRAGTALRNIFNGLLGGVTLTAAAFGELDYSAVNSDGSMKGLTETVKDLRIYFDQMTESEKVMNAQNIAGMRGYNGLLAILNATDEDFQSLYASVTDCTGAAERMAKVKLDNLNGDITIMNSAMEALQSTIGEQFNPELRELTQLKTEILNGVNEFIQENPALAKGVMAVLPNGTKVRNYGYYTMAGGVKWLYVQVTYSGVTYTGFMSSQYLRKQ